MTMLMHELNVELHAANVHIHREPDPLIVYEEGTSIIEHCRRLYVEISKVHGVICGGARI